MELFLSKKVHLWHPMDAPGPEKTYADVRVRFLKWRRAGGDGTPKVQCHFDAVRGLLFFEFSTPRAATPALVRQLLLARCLSLHLPPTNCAPPEHFPRKGNFVPLMQGMHCTSTRAPGASPAPLRTTSPGKAFTRKVTTRCTWTASSSLSYTTQGGT